VGKWRIEQPDRVKEIQGRNMGDSDGVGEHWKNRKRIGEKNVESCSKEEALSLKMIGGKKYL